MTKEQLIAVLEAGMKKCFDRSGECRNEKDGYDKMTFCMGYADALSDIINLVRRFDFGPEEPDWDGMVDAWR